jgi:uncharacterized protein YndB with AHSA1/START domain
MNTHPFVIERTFNAPVEKVWEAITDKDQMKQWYFPMLESFEPVVGFQTEFNVRFEGKDHIHIWKVTEVIPNKKISYEWRYGGFEGNSLVTFELFSEGNATRLRLTHAGLETFPPLADFARENFAKGWTELIGSLLKAFVEQ